MVKINTKKLGLKKPVFVKVTVKKIKLADMMMNKLLKLGIEQDMLIQSVTINGTWQDN